MKNVSQIIQEAEAAQTFVNSQTLQEIQKSVQLGFARIDAVEKLSKSATRIVKEAVDRLLSKGSLWTEPTSKRQIAACMGGCEIILRYITYALLAGDPAVLDECCLNGLRGTYVALGISTDFVIQAVNLMKAVAIESINVDDLSTEVAGYFDHVVISLREREELQPL
ncbi:hypothetical protein AB3R30_19370 [Leptolyngbyaceae cyanobacterium UHCC 1019]